MQESTKENKPVIINTVKGRIGTEGNSQDRFFPVDPEGEPIIPIKKPTAPVYDEKGKLITPPPSTGDIVDLEA